MTSSGEKIIQFYNCDILRDHKIIREDLWVRNKKIINPEPIFFDEKVAADIKIDCHGALISPGFIDLQINEIPCDFFVVMNTGVVPFRSRSWMDFVLVPNQPLAIWFVRAQAGSNPQYKPAYHLVPGGFGHDFSVNVTNPVESVTVIAQGLLKYGVTSFCPTLISSPPEKYRQIIPQIKKVNGSKNGAGVLGIHAEGPFINREKKGAHPVQYIKPICNGYQDILDTYGSIDNICLITIAPELDPEGLLISELVKHNIMVSLGHSAASLSEGEKAMKQGASFITHLFNAMLPFHHRDPGLVGLLTSQKLPQDKTVFYGIIADGIHTHPAALRIAYRSNPKGLVLVTDAMQGMGLKPGNYCMGEQKIEVTCDRAVVAGTNTLGGSIATMDGCVRFLRKSTGCSLVEALECATLHPAQVLGIENQKGTLDFGTHADFNLLDENLHVVSTYIAGECVWDCAWKSEVSETTL